jgi:hypothetical protein
VSAEQAYILPAPAWLEAIRAAEALEQGDWRTARDLAPQLGRPGVAVRLLALSMRERALGMVVESWQALTAAADCPAERRSRLRSTGPGDHTALPWPSRVGNEFWCRFGLVGQREEFQARSQWLRIEDSAYPKRTCLVAGCVDHLTWVFLDRSTWRSSQAGEWLPASDRVTRGRFGEAGREYFLRRANELFHSVWPLRGSLTRKVWDDLGAYRGLHEAALTALTERDDTHTAHVVQRLAYTSAIAWARQVS